MLLSFYLDDTNPGKTGPEAFGTFIRYCRDHGIKGESSLIPGFNGETITKSTDPEIVKYVDLAARAFEYGIDSHMEIMTHGELFDFSTGKTRPGGIHEGLWLHEPGVSTDEYYAYFSRILDDASVKNLKFTGLTWPGCSCEVCTLRYDALRKNGPLHFNPRVYDALLKLAGEDRFRNPVVAVFYNADEKDYGILQKATNGRFGIYDLMPNVMDRFASWDNTVDKLDADYYINEDGTSGMIPDHLRKGSPYAIWYMHWQGVNPENGLGWEAFKTVTGRIKKYLKDDIVWMQPGEIVSRYHDAGGWDFLDEI